MRLLTQTAFTPRVRVFVADDEAVIANTLASVLALAGCEVCAVYGGEATLRLIDLLKPSLVVTDITLPGAAPWEIAATDCLTLPRCKVLLFTGQADLHYLLRTEDAVSLPFDLIARPIQPAGLLALLHPRLCSDHPPLLMPLDTHEDQIH